MNRSMSGSVGGGATLEDALREFWSEYLTVIELRRMHEAVAVSGSLAGISCRSRLPASAPGVAKRVGFAKQCQAGSLNKCLTRYGSTIHVAPCGT